MTEIKTTQKDLFIRIAETMADDPEVVELCEKKIAALSKPRKPRENTAVVEFRNCVATWLSEQEGPVLNADCAAYFEVSPQKSASALNWLVKEGCATKIDAEGAKGKAAYIIA